MGSDGKSTAPFSKRILAAFFGAMIVSGIVVAYFGRQYLFRPHAMSWRENLTFVNSCMSVAAMLLLAGGCVRGMCRHVRARHLSNCVAFGIGLIFAMLWSAKELIIISRQGFSPEPLVRTLFIFIWFVLGALVAFPVSLEEEKATEGDPSRQEEKKTPPLGWGGVVLATTVMLLFVCTDDFFFGMLRSAFGHNGTEPVPSQTPRPHPALSPPASYEEIAKAFVAICAKDSASPGGSGVFVGTLRDGKRTVLLLTAAHVTVQCIKSGCTNSIPVLLHRGGGKPDFVITLKGRTPSDLAWGVPLTQADISVVDVTPYFNSLVEKGWDIKYLPLAFLPEEWPDDCAVRGVVSLPRKLFKDYRIGIGTRVMAFGTAIEMWSSEEAKKHQPLAVRTGIISARQDFPTQWPGVASTAPIMVECNTLPGFSGGPVFAEIKNGMLTYPAFIGVSSCMITRGHVPLDTNPGLPNLSGFSLVSALDELVKQDAGTNLPTNGATSARTASPIESPDSE